MSLYGATLAPNMHIGIHQQLRGVFDRWSHHETFGRVEFGITA